MPDRIQAPRRKCGRCGAPIVWARTVAGENGPGGKAMPLDPDPNPAGNVAVRHARRNELLARVLKADEDHDPQVEVRAVPHFATCRADQKVAERQAAAGVIDFAAARARKGATA